MPGRVLERWVTSGIFLPPCAWRPAFLEAASGAQEPSGGRTEGSRGLALPSNCPRALGLLPRDSVRLQDEPPAPGHTSCSTRQGLIKHLSGEFLGHLSSLSGVGARDARLIPELPLEQGLREAVRSARTLGPHSDPQGQGAQQDITAPPSLHTPTSAPRCTTTLDPTTSLLHSTGSPGTPQSPQHPGPQPPPCRSRYISAAGSQEG